MFVSAVKLVTTDKGFDIGTETAQKARLVAHKLLVKTTDEKSVSYFSSWLVEEVSKSVARIHRTNVGKVL